MKCKNLRVFVFVFACLFTGCSNPNNDPLRNFLGSYKNYYNTTGKISGGRYFAPNNIFSVKIPNLIKPGAVIKDNLSKDFGTKNDAPDVGTIAFSDDFGTFIRIDVFSLPSNLDLKKTGTEVLLKGIQEYMLSVYKETVPDAKIVKQEFINWKGKQANLFTADLKKAGNIVSNGIRQDVFRTAIAFIDNRYIYIFSTQMSENGFFRKKAETKEQLFQNMKEEILKTMDSFEPSK